MPGKLPPKIDVEWLDSTVLDYGGWLDTDDAKRSMMQKNLTYHSSGFLVHENSVAICLATSVDHDGGRVQGATVIPKCAILKRSDAG